MKADRAGTRKTLASLTSVRSSPVSKRRSPRTREIHRQVLGRLGVRPLPPEPASRTVRLGRHRRYTRLRRRGARPASSMISVCRSRRRPAGEDRPRQGPGHGANKSVTTRRCGHWVRRSAGPEAAARRNAIYQPTGVEPYEFVETADGQGS